MFTTLPYQYRDGANFKESSAIVLNGVLTASDIAAITATLESGEKFIPYDLQLDIAELQDRLPSFPDEDDHVFHELLLEELDVSDTVPEGTSTIDVDDFLKAFAAVRSRRGWDIVNAVDRLGV
jgi:hypothetical protein